MVIARWKARRPARLELDAGEDDDGFHRPVEHIRFTRGSGHSVICRNVPNGYDTGFLELEAFAIICSWGPTDSHRWQLPRCMSRFQNIFPIPQIADVHVNRSLYQRKMTYRFPNIWRCLSDKRWRMTIPLHSVRCGWEYKMSQAWDEVDRWFQFPLTKVEKARLTEAKRERHSLSWHVFFQTNQWFATDELMQLAACSRNLYYEVAALPWRQRVINMWSSHPSRQPYLNARAYTSRHSSPAPDLARLWPLPSDVDERLQTHGVYSSMTQEEAKRTANHIWKCLYHFLIRVMGQVSIPHVRVCLVPSISDQDIDRSPDISICLQQDKRSDYRFFNNGRFKLKTRHCPQISPKYFKLHRSYNKKGGRKAKSKLVKSWLEE